MRINIPEDIASLFTRSILETLVVNSLGEIHNDDGPAIESGASKIWVRNNKIHRDDGPALISTSQRIWYSNGFIHRDGAPAIEHTSFCKYREWWQHGKLHRDDGPAVERNDDERWYKMGELHREDGPAISNDYHQEWFINGLRHREDGPAYISKGGGRPEYYLFNNRINKRSFTPKNIEKIKLTRVIEM